MTPKLIVPAVAALLVAVCLVASSQLAEGQKRKSRTKATEVNGKDWRVLRDALDEAFEEMQEDEGIVPAPIVDDGTFLRRVYLDLTGAPPSPAEIAEFEPGKLRRKQTQEEKREALVEQLLASPEFADHMATWWSTIMSERRGYGRGPSYQALRDAFAANTPWDKVVNNVLAPSISTRGKRGEVVTYYGRGYIEELAYLQDFGYLVGMPVKVFLGRQVGCAECHDHPYDPYTQDDFEAWSAFFKTFVDVRQVGDESYISVGREMQFRNTADLERQLQLKGRYKLPRYLDGTDWKLEPGKSPRQQMADWVTSPENPWFREMTVNRYMDYFMGIGFVTPVDDFNALNDPTIPVILRVLGKDFADSGFDTRYLVRAIVNSRMYQRMSAPNPSNQTDRMLYSRQFVRELSPEVIERSILKATGIERLNPPKGISKKQAEMNAAYGYGSPYRAQLRALLTQAYEGDPAVKDLDDRNTNPMRALMFMNGDLLPDGQDNAVKEIMRRTADKMKRGELIFQTVLGRSPTEREREILRVTFVRWTGGEEVYEDLFLALMNTSEFFNRH
ncbi:MAG: DUF1549 domain-containing protein [Planctomycetes bacterium]|nr:DUF1549 domain-containing protein [Planctomycetota bacterium]MCW8136283.1 DUF1549 domain-containing protein [Planctomycetota bacterium]